MSGSPAGGYSALKSPPRTDFSPLEVRFDVGCSSCQLAVVGGVMRVVKIEHEETLQVVFQDHPRSGPAGGGVGVVAGSDRESAGGKADPGADRPGGEDRQGVHRPPEPDGCAGEFQTG